MRGRGGQGEKWGVGGAVERKEGDVRWKEWRSWSGGGWCL